MQNNQHSKETGTKPWELLNLYSSYTEPYLLDELGLISKYSQSSSLSVMQIH